MAPSGMAGGTVKVAAICGSLRKGSYNIGLIRSAIKLSKGAVEGVEIEEVDIASLPMLNNNLEKQGTFPRQSRSFLAIGERNGLGIKATKRVGRQSYKHCRHRRVARMSKRPISSSLNWNIIDLHFLNKPKFFLNAFKPPPKFNPLNGDLIDEDAKLRLKEMLLSLKAFTLQIHHNN